MRVLACLFFLPAVVTMFPAAQPGCSAATWRIIPEPQQVVRRAEASFDVGAATAIIVPPKATTDDMFAANQLRKKMFCVTDRPVPVKRYQPGISLKGAVVLGGRGSGGVYDNPAVERLLSQWPEARGKTNRGQGSLVGIGSDGIVVCGFDSAGTFYGCQSVIQLLEQMQGSPLPGMLIYDWPDLKRRGTCMGMEFFGSYDSAFAEEIASEVIARYKMNVIELGMHRGTRYASHPDLDYAHNAVSMDHVRAFADTVRRYHIEIVPLGASNTHADQWVTDTHPEWAVDGHLSNLDLTKPGAQRFIKDIIDEQIEACKPSVMSIGGDESDIGPEETMQGWLFMREYAKKKGVRAMIWGDVVERYDLGPKLPKDLIIQDWDYDSSKTDHPSLKVWTDLGMTTWVSPYGVYSRDGVPGPYNIYYSAISAKKYGAEGLVAFNKARLGQKSRTIVNNKNLMDNYGMFAYYAEWSWHVGELPAGPLPFDGKEMFLRQIAPDRPANPSAARSGSNVVLTWNTPTNSNTVGVRVCRGSVGYPVDVEGGDLVCDISSEPGEAATFTQDLPAGTRAYYSFFAYDKYRHYSAPSHAFIQ